MVEVAFGMRLYSGTSGIANDKNKGLYKEEVGRNLKRERKKSYTASTAASVDYLSLKEC